jgi:hypothetical protein
MELEDLAYRAAMALCPTLSTSGKISREDAQALAALIKGYDTCANRVRILRNKPLPGSRRLAAEPRQARKPRHRCLPPRLFPEDEPETNPPGPSAASPEPLAGASWNETEYPLNT